MVTRWAPTGFRLESRRYVNIYSVNVGDGIPHKLTNSRGTDSVPSWSRDGRTIYFGSDRSGTLQLWKMNADGSSPQQITKTGGYAPLTPPNVMWIFSIRVL